MEELKAVLYEDSMDRIIKQIKDGENRTGCTCKIGHY